MAQVRIFQKKLVIFDLDGTLLDTLEDLGIACNFALSSCGFPERDPGEYNMLVGRGIYNLFRGALPENCRKDENLIRKMKEAFVPFYNEHKCDRTKPYPGIEQALKAISERGAAIAVATNKYQDGADQLVRRFFPDTEFVAVLGQREGFPIKPDPEVIYEIMRKAGIESADRVIYAGDSDVDMQTGKNAGVRTIGVSWGFRTVEELMAYEPWKICGKAEELVSAIEEI